jgi:hypothetical protein
MQTKKWLNPLQRVSVCIPSGGTALVCLPLVFAVLGCGRSDPQAEASSAISDSDPAAETLTDAVDESAPEPEATTTDMSQPLDVAHSLSEAQQRLNAGEFDTAAAELLRVQMEGRRFDADQAAAYRETLGQATAAAVAAAERGDPRGQAALQMLRAARRR